MTLGARKASAATPVKAAIAEEGDDMAGNPDSRSSSPSGQGCTQAQLRRFIKSRAYVPMHELRRRFDINGDADDVRAVETRDGRYWAGLPQRECGFLAELVDRGEVGLELCHDPDVKVVVGVYAIKPVGR